METTCTACGFRIGAYEVRYYMGRVWDPVKCESRLTTLCKACYIKIGGV
jgi:hypothetical protein